MAAWAAGGDLAAEPENSAHLSGMTVRPGRCGQLRPGAESARPEQQSFGEFFFFFSLPSLSDTFVREGPGLSTCWALSVFKNCIAKFFYRELG